MKLKIKEIVKKNLISESRKKDYLYESYSKLNNLKGEKLIDGYVKTTFQLMEEGYDFDEIELFLNEEENVLSGIMGDNMNFGNILKGGLWSSVKEYGYKWFFTSILGLDEDRAQTLAMGLADTSPLEFLRMFKDEGSCKQAAPKIIDSVAEIMVRNFGGDMISKENQGILSVSIGNSIGEAIRESNIGEMVVEKTGLCRLIHKEK